MTQQTTQVPSSAEAAQDPINDANSTKQEDPVSFGNINKMFELDSSGANSAQHEGKILLVYWNVRGLAQWIRHLLEYLKLPYVERRVQVPTELVALGKLDALDSQKYIKCQLPYIVDKGFIVQEDIPIAKYLCKKANRRDLLGGDNIVIQAKINELLCQAIMFRNIMRFMFGNFNQDFDPNKLVDIALKVFKQIIKTEYIKQMREVFARGGWTFGDKLTIADFIVYESVFYMAGMFPKLMTEFKGMAVFKHRFETIQQIQDYNNSDRVVLRIFALPIASVLWRGDPKYKSY